MSVITALPRVIDGLLAQLQASTTLAGFDLAIFDGLEIDHTYGGDWIAVGIASSDSDETTAGSATNAWRTLGAKRMQEQATVDCVLAVIDGDTDPKSKRTRAYEIFNAIDTAIRADVSLGGACLFAGLASHELVYRQTKVGLGIEINFSIAYEART